MSRNYRPKLSLTNRSFTLIELLIVIAIIGILISIVSVGWASVSRRGRDTTRKSDLARIKQALQQEYSDTRLYPAFDNSQGLIYGASWQLTSNGILSCAHPDPAGTRLTPKYLAEIPHDPQDSINYTQSCGTDLTEHQLKRYIYISSPTDATAGPTPDATGFALMATLEQSASDYISIALNPLKSTSTAFGSWYEDRDSYNNPIRVDANYLIDSKNQ